MLWRGLAVVVSGIALARFAMAWRSCPPRGARASIMSATRHFASEDTQSLRLLFPPTCRPTSKVLSSNGLTVLQQPFYTTTDIKSRMSVIALPGGMAAIYAPIAATPECVKLTQEVGRVTHVIMQNDAVDHTVFLAGWRKACPEALIHAVNSDNRAGDVALVEGSNTVVLPPELQRLGVQAALLDVSPFFREVVLFHSPSKTLIVADSVWRVIDPQFKSNPIAEVGWYLFGVHSTAQHPYWFYFPRRKREEVAVFVRQVAAWDFRRVVTAHLDMITDGEDAKAIFTEAFRYILKP